MKQMNDEEREEQIQAKGLNAPRLTPEDIDSKIADIDYHVFPGTTLTVCMITLANGFPVTGESAAASKENFDEEIGKSIAYNNARDKIWALEGYLLKEKLSDGRMETVEKENVITKVQVGSQYDTLLARNTLNIRVVFSNEQTGNAEVVMDSNKPISLAYLSDKLKGKTAEESYSMLEKLGKVTLLEG